MQCSTALSTVHGIVLGAGNARGHSGASEPLLDDYPPAMIASCYTVFCILSIMHSTVLSIVLFMVSVLLQATQEVIVEQVEPLLDDYRPAMITSMRFTKLTLGNVPPEIEGGSVCLPP